MIERPIWRDRILSAWRRAPVVWLCGPRRTGKTVLGRSFPNASYWNCDLPSTARHLEDPETFFRSLKTDTVVLDEVHQLPDPSRLLKIGADEFPKLKILAAGSSTLAATQKFRDTLTGRKRVVPLTPVLHEELEAFGIRDLKERLHRGGLPPALLSESHDAEFYSEWLDSYFARDVQELFRLEKWAGFLNVLSLLLRQSGGMLDVSRLARDAQISRPTVMNWLEVYQATQTIHLLRPFAGGGRSEIVAQPRVYGFDTGFVAHARGWDTLRADDCGMLWEHLVLDALIASGTAKIHYWRDKSDREIDFVVPRKRDVVDAVECKWNAESFETRNLLAFRAIYPNGSNYVLSPQTLKNYSRTMSGLKIEFISTRTLRETMAAVS
jgi:predicted AAA+ superfamily ATPase